MIEWNDSYLVGIELIDSQHMKLFDKVNTFTQSALDNNNKHSVNETISFMKSYILNHFRDEEDFMDSIDYPRKAEQEKAHDEFVDKHLDYILKAVDGDRDEVQSSITFLENWLIKHVAEEDKKIGDYFRTLK